MARNSTTASEETEKPAESIGTESVVPPARGSEMDVEWQEELTLVALDVIDALVMVLDSEGRIIRFNRACEKSTGYAFEEVRGKRPWELLLVAEDIDRWLGKFERLREGSFPSKYQLYWLAKDGKRKLIEWTEIAMFDADGKAAFVLGTGMDISEQALSRQSLEHHIQERTKELSTLLRVSHDVASTLDLKPLMEIILDQLKGVVTYTGATIMTLEGEELKLFAHRGPFPPPKSPSGSSSPSRSPNRDMILKGDALFIPDILVDSPLVDAVRNMGVDSDLPIFNFVRSAMVVPLVTKEEILGVLILGHSKPNYYTIEQANLVRAFANQAAISIEKARLYANAKRGSDVAQAMYNIHRTISHRLGISATLSMVAMEAKDLASADAGIVSLVKANRLSVAATSGIGTVDPIGREYEPNQTAAGAAVDTGGPLTLDMTDPTSQSLCDLEWYPGARKAMVVPILSGSNVTGALTVYSSQDSWPTVEDEDTITKLAASAAIAIELNDLRETMEAD